jgi:hypothetical protein
VVFCDCAVHVCEVYHDTTRTDISSFCLCNPFCIRCHSEGGTESSAQPCSSLLSDVLPEKM